MLRGMVDSLNAAAAQSDEEVWSCILDFTAAGDALVVLIANSSGKRRDALYLQTWLDHVRRLTSGKAAPASKHDQELLEAVRRMIGGQLSVRRVFYEREVGANILLAALPFRGPGSLPGVNPYDPNAMFVRLDCRNPLKGIHLLGVVDPNHVATLRLQRMWNQAAPVVASVVQASPLLYQPGPLSGAGLVIYSLDARISAPLLMRAATEVFEAKLGETDDGAIEAAAQFAMLGHERFDLTRRTAFSPEFADGMQLILAEAWINRGFLVDGYFSQRQPRLLPFLVARDHSAPPELIPYDKIGQIWPAEVVAMLLPRT